MIARVSRCHLLTCGCGLNIGQPSAEALVISVWPRATRWGWHPIWWCNIDIHVIANGEFGLWQCQILIGGALTGTGDANFTHPIARPKLIREHEGKIKIRSLSSSIGVDIAHQSGEFSERCIWPCVNLQFIRWHDAVIEFVWGMMASGGTEHAKQQRARLWMMEE